MNFMVMGYIYWYRMYHLISQIYTDIIYLEKEILNFLYNCYFNNIFKNNQKNFMLHLLMFIIIST